MIIERYESDLLSSNMYVLSENGHALVIDPYRNTDPVNELTVDRILLTHEHYDHISGVNLFKSRMTAPVLCNTACAENIRNPRKNLARIFEVFCELQNWIVLDQLPDSDPEYTCTADDTFDDETSFEWQGHQVHLFEIPGHSSGSIGIIVDRHFCFSGDSLMEDRATELRFPGGSPKDWETRGKRRLQALPDGLRIYPGHFHDFELNWERRRQHGLSV